jgi:hypothetical protein
VTELRLNKQDIDWREVEGEVIALRRSTAEYLGVNPAGTLLWNALRGGASETRLTELLVERYGIDANAARADVASFIGQLRSQGLVQTG